MCLGLPQLGRATAADTPPKWNDGRMLIFTEYADTKRYLQHQLLRAVAATDRGAQRIATLHGGMDEESREEVKRAFNADPGVVGTTMSVAQHNPKGPWWYDVFSFACGNPGACTVETMKQWKKEVVADRKGLTDPCSGTRITGLDYQFGHMPGNDAAREVEVTFQLHVKPKSLDLAPRSEECPEK